VNRLRNLLHIREGEGRPLSLLFSYLTLIFTAYVISKAIRDALFLDRFGAANLPYVYVGVAALIAVVVALYIRLSVRFSQPILVCATLVFFMANALLMWWAVRAEWKLISVAYYMFVNIFGIVVTAQVWTLATTVLSTGQARRLFPLLCSGGVLGSMLGGAIATAGVRQMGTDNLILVPVLILGLCVPIVRTLARYYTAMPHYAAVEAPDGEEGASVGSVLRVTMRTRYLRLIASLLCLSAIVTLLVDFQFKTIIDNYFRTKDAMTGFFGSFHAYVGLLSFGLQIFAGGRIFKRYSVPIGLLFLPMALLGGTAALLAFPSVVWAGVFLKGSEGVLRSSIDKSTVEMLYIPVPQSARVQVKAVIDIMIQRFSDGIGGILLLVLTQAIGVGLVGVGMFNIVLLILWIWIARQTRAEYQTALRQPLSGD
jgi:AAA family ATP:ADP antiporter